MIRFVSTRGGVEPTSFDEAVLQGFAADGGLFVPDAIPRLSPEQLEEFADLSFSELAFELVSLFVDPSIVPREKLRSLLDDSFGSFSHPDVVDLVPVDRARGVFVLELFHGPTLSFKDMAMGFLMNIVDHFLEQRGQHLNIVLATTGDTGPAAAWAARGKTNIDCWPLYPRGMISEEQERQMTTLSCDNVHPVGVERCADGGDDLDIVVAELFGDTELKRSLGLSSVNSINWCRVMLQTVHFFHAYYRAVGKVGDPVVFSVPTGAFGNLFGGYLARCLGLPVARFICANNVNQGLHSAFSTGAFPRRDLVQTPSSAIDIVAPYNFWRFLYFACGGDAGRIRQWMEDFAQRREARLDPETLRVIQDGFQSASISDQATLNTIRDEYGSGSGYLFDPHGAVAFAAARLLESSLPENAPVICLATAHPAKFPDVIRKALEYDELPATARHPSIENARELCQHLRLCDLQHLKAGLIRSMQDRQARRIRPAGRG